MRELRRILFVEDDPDICEVAQLALETVGGFKIEACSSGQEAIARGQAFAPGLMLLDVMMPCMDGPTTLARLREIPDLASTPFIFMTAKVQPQEVAGFRALGALGVIPKPFDPMGLADQIRAIWDGSAG